MPTRASVPRPRGGRTGSHILRLPYGDDSFRFLVEAVVDYAIFLLDTEGHVLTWNDGAVRIKGYTAEEIIGRHFSLFYTPEDRAAGRPERVLRSAESAGRYEDEGWRVRKDGTRFWADVLVTALRSTDGELYGYAKVTRDLTERREAQRREQQLVVERERRNAAERALEARDRFLSVASHELKTPMSNIQLAAEAVLLAHQRGTLTAERLDASIGRLRRAVQRMGLLVGELLDVTRLTSGPHLDLAPVALHGLGLQVVERFQAVSERQISAAIEPVTLVADEIRVEQVITNLIDNALKYSPAATDVELRVAPAEGGAVIEVRDRGMGLSDRQRDTLFEPFVRGDDVAAIPGMGLGLFISQQIVVEHGGTIAVEPRSDGPGTLVRVWLPARESGPVTP